MPPKSTYDLPPEAEYLRELHTHIAGPYWQPQRTIDQKFTDLYYDQHAVPAQNMADKRRRMRVETERFTTGEPARIIGLMGSFYPTPPEIDAEYAGADAYNATRAESAGRAWNEAIDQLNPPTGDQPWADGGEEQDLYGRCADLIIQTKLHYADYPGKTAGQTEAEAAKQRQQWKLKSPLPILWQTLPAVSTFPAYLSTAEDEVLSELDMSYHALRGMFSDKELSGVMPDDKKRWFEEGTLGIHSNRYHLTYCWLPQKKTGGLVGVGSGYADKVLRSVPHGMGRCAIRLHPGLTSARKEPGYYWRSVLFAVLGLLETLDKLATAARTGAKFDIAPILVEYRNRTNADIGDGAKSEVAEFVDVITLAAGDPMTNTPPEKIEPLFVPQNNEQTRELMLYIERKIERITGAVEILEGSGAPNQTAWSENFRAETAKGKLRPVTHRRMGRARGVAESIAAALSALGEDVALAERDEKGKRIGAMTLKVAELEDYTPMIVANYDAQLPMNERADTDLGMKIQAMILKDESWGVSPIDIAKRYFKQGDPWLAEGEAETVRFMRTEAVRKLQQQDVAEAFEAGLSDEDKMTMAEIDAAAQGLPQPTIEILKKYGIDMAQMQPPANGAQPTVTPQTQGALRAAQPFVTGPGPGPQEQMVQ